MCASEGGRPAPSPLSRIRRNRLPSLAPSLAFGGGGNHFRSGEFGQSSSGLRATYRGRRQILPQGRLQWKGAHETYCNSLRGHPEFMSGGGAVEELYLHNPRAAAAVWFWLACHYWCGTERSLPLPFFNEIAFDGDWTDGRTDHETTTATKRERGRRFKTYGAEEAALLPRS